MFWLLLSAIVGSIIALAWIAWRRSTAHWRQIEGLVSQIASGEKPRTFLVEGGIGSKRLGLALEKVFARQQDLERHRGQREERFGRFTEMFRHGAVVVLLSLSK